MSKNFNSPNDLAVRADENVYFTDPAYQCNGTGCGQGGTKRAYRVSPSGEVTPITTTNATPNGIALSPDGSKLYVAGDTEIQVFTLNSDGSIMGNGATFAAVSGVDGMTVDCAGNLYATVHAQGKISVYEPTGTPIGDLAVGSNVTNVAFGGADMTTLYITTYSTKEVRSVTLEVPGLPY
jgi:gluconolactonase